MMTELYQYNHKTGNYKAIFEYDEKEPNKLFDFIKDKKSEYGNYIVKKYIDGECKFYKLTYSKNNKDGNLIEIKPIKLLDDIGFKSVLIKAILGQPIHPDFAHKCLIDAHTRGTNRFLKYKKLFEQNIDGQYRWKNNVNDHTAFDILSKYSVNGLEELYLDLESFL